MSVIIPCYNAESWIGETLQSCLAQTHRPIEVIVVDDGSQDQSARTVKGFVKRNVVPIRLIKTRSPRCSHGAESGLDNHARGLSADFWTRIDLVSPRKLELRSVLAGKTLGPLFAARGHGSGDQMAVGQRSNRSQSADCADDLIHQWLEGKFFVVHSFLWPRKALAGLGGWDESLSACQDWDLYVRALLQGKQFCFVPHSTVSLPSRAFERIHQFHVEP